jgi:hypothetical protein
MLERDIRKAPQGLAHHETAGYKRLDASLLPMPDADHFIIG